MNSLLPAFLALAPLAALAWPAGSAPAAQIPQPAVARIIVAEKDGMSLGSGELVAVDASHGLVVTNWHVVRDAAGPITVVFPDGFRSGALLLMTDRDWDLAALAIQRPNVAPLTLAAEAPRPGEPLAIAGYGPDGTYRAVSGRCTEYLSPGGNLPAELVEVDVQARRGDSGGPIYNSRGEIAGILFGSGGNMWTGGYTMGSYCGRVRQFLAASYVGFQRLPGNAAMLAQAPAPLPPPPDTANPAGGSIVEGPPPSGDNGFEPTSSGPQSLPPPPGYLSQAYAAAPPAVREPSVRIPAGRPASSTAGRQAAANSPIAEVPSTSASTGDLPPSRSDQIKTVLAVIGIIAMLFHGLRFIASAVG